MDDEFDVLWDDRQQDCRREGVRPMELDDIRLKLLDDLPQHSNIRQRYGLSGNGHQSPDAIHFYAVYLTHTVEVSLIKADHCHLMTGRVVCHIFADILHPSYIRIIIFRYM
jgi:hypothetical protein